MFMMSKMFTDANASDDFYFALPIPCRVVGAQFATDTVNTADDETITLSDGTTDIGVITVALSGAAEGNISNIVFDSTSLGAVELDKDTPLKIVITGNSSGLVGNMTIMFSEYHGG